MFARYDGARYTLVGVNTGDADQTVPFWFPIAGNYVEELHGGGSTSRTLPALQRGRADDPVALRPHLDGDRLAASGWLRSIGFSLRTACGGNYATAMRMTGCQI